jgi:acyl-homoserine lactone acylase PvdQ
MDALFFAQGYVQAQNLPREYDPARGFINASSHADPASR